MNMKRLLMIIIIIIMKMQKNIKLGYSRSKGDKSPREMIF